MMNDSICSEGKSGKKKSDNKLIYQVKEVNQGDGSPDVATKKLALPTGTERHESPFTVQLNVDMMQWSLFALALLTRTWNLENPRQIVFDELHFGRFAVQYINRIFFFESSPPLGKLLLAAGAYIGGFDGSFNFSDIGEAYSADVPVWHMRMGPAVFGSLLVPLVYQLATELRLTRYTAALAALLVLTDNALLTQSRFVLLEPSLLFFIFLSLLALLKFRHSHSYTWRWWSWLTLMAVSMASALSIRYVGLFTCILVLSAVTRDLWLMLPDSRLSDAQLWRHLVVRLSMLVGLPVLIYLSVFYVHLSILTKAGPHDDVMSSVFQSSLEGGLASVTRGQPSEVAYGSRVTLRHASRPCWLHSHRDVYPVRYPDDRGSSHQQQVTCYGFKDVNNWWIVKDPTRNSVVVDDPVIPVRHGDIVQLIHGESSRALNSHDVGAPMSPQYMEVSCFVDYNISTPSQNLWKFEITNRKNDNETWKTISSQVMLVHVNTSQALKITGKQLPDWGFHQLEVATDKYLEQEATQWNVEEHEYSRVEDDEKRAAALREAERSPLRHAQLGFFSKFFELQLKMLRWPSHAVRDHLFSSRPLDWPLLDTNILYLVNPETQATISLVGNPVIWYSGSICLFVYLSLLIFYLFRRRRCCYDLSPERWSQFINHGQLLGGGYLLHFLPFFLVPHSLFLFVYLPALVFKILLLAACIEHVYHLLQPWAAVQRLYMMLLLVWLSAVCSAFYAFLPLSYASPIRKTQLQHLHWKQAWDFFVK